MKAAVFRGVGKPLVVETIDDPTPGPGEVVIKVHRCGICGTDLHMAAGHMFQIPDGTILGHEFAGEVVAIGAGVDNLKLGDRITAPPSFTCGQCRACLGGNLTQCTNNRQLPGGFSEYRLVSGRLAVKLPDSLSLADGALVEPLAVGLHGVRTSAIKPGDRVLIQGAGPVALNTLFWARRLGAARIAVTSRSPHRKAMAMAMGADAYVQSGDDELPEVIEALGGAPDIVFECIGAPGQLGRAIQHVARGGQIVSMGFCTEAETIIPARAGLKNLRLNFPVGWALNDFQYSADTMDAGKVDPRLMVTSVVTLEELPAMFEKLGKSHDETKVQVAP